MSLRLLSARARPPCQSRRVIIVVGLWRDSLKTKVVTTAPLPCDLRLAVPTGNRAHSLMELVIRVGFDWLSPPSRGKVFMADITHKRNKRNELTVVDKASEWRRMKSLVLDSVRSPITKRVYNMALDEFFGWYAQEPRPGFTKATVNAWRVTLEERGLGSSSIIVRMSAIRKLAGEATDNGLLAPELAARSFRLRQYRARLRLTDCRSG